MGKTVTAGRPFVFDHLALYSMLDARFIEQVKAPFNPDLVNKLRRIATASVKGRSCESCGLLVDVVRPLMTDLGDWLEENSGSQRDAFIALVVEARKYRPKPIILHWRRANGTVGTLNL